MNRDLALGNDPRTPAPRGDLAALARSGLVEGGRRSAHQVPQLDLPTLLRVLREWRWLILAAAVLGLAGGIVVTMLTKPQYRAGVTLEVNPPQFEVVAEDARMTEGGGGQNLDFIATQVGLLRSRAVAERTAEELNLANQPLLAGEEGTIQQRLRRATTAVSRNLTVEPPSSGSLIRFSVRSPDPQLSAAVANGIAESFINSGLQRRFESSAYARQFLERQIARTRTDLERSERQLAQYAQAEGIIELGGGQGQDGRPVSGSSLQGESLAALNAALAAATARRVASEGAYRAAAASGPTSDVNESTQALRQSRATLEAEYSEKLTVMRPEHPEMISLRSRIDALGTQIAREGAQVTAGRSNTLAQDYRAAVAAERALQSRVSSLRGEVLDLRGRSVRYAILQREVDTNRGLYDALLQRYKEIGVAGGVGTTPVSIVDRAQVPSRPFTPNLPLNLLAGLGVGLLAGLGLAISLELLRDTILTREDVRNKLGLACLGQIPKRAGKGEFVEDLQNPASPISEAYNAAAAALRFTTEQGAPRAFMLTSTQSAEGKSSSALALSQNFARLGYRVLLIDADLRKPAFRAADEEIGLVRLLTADEPLLQHTAPTQFENLWLLPCGPLPPSPADLLSTGRFHAIVEEAKASFDMVVIDAPPVLGLADAPLLAGAVSHVLFVIQSGRTRSRQAAECLNRLEATGAHLLGGLLTKSAETSGNYGYYSYRYGAMSDKRKKIVMIPHHKEA